MIEIAALDRITPRALCAALPPAPQRTKRRKPFRCQVADKAPPVIVTWGMDGDDAAKFEREARLRRLLGDPSQRVEVPVQPDQRCKMCRERAYPNRNLDPAKRCPDDHYR